MAIVYPPKRSGTGQPEEGYKESRFHGEIRSRGMMLIFLIVVIHLSSLQHRKTQGFQAQPHAGILMGIRFLRDRLERMDMAFRIWLVILLNGAGLPQGWVAVLIRLRMSGMYQFLTTGEL